MKHYFYADTHQQLGPFSVEELRSKRLKKTTLVWTDGMQDWATAESIDELRDILISEPPPLPQKNNALLTTETIQIKKTPVTSAKYDLSYTKEGEATFLGVMLLIVPIVLKFIGWGTFVTEDSYNQAKTYFVICSLVIRIVATVWVVNIASRQNRNSTGWGWFAFLIPSIALIVIGQLKKLRLKIELDGSLSANQHVAILFEKATQLFAENRNSECIEILNKATEIEDQNFDCIKLRGLANYLMKDYDKAKTDFEELNRYEKYPSITNYYLGNLAIIGHDREKAVSYWLIAKENDNVIRKLNQFHNFSGQYLLDSSQVAKKLAGGSNLYFTDGKYEGGLAEIDRIEKLDHLKTEIKAHDNGLEIKLRKASKEYHIAVAFYEIDNITYNEIEKQFELHLADENILKFSYDQSKDYTQGLKRFCDRFKEKTGKIPTASSFWKQ